MRGIIRTALVTILILATTLLAVGNLSARTLICNTNEDFFSKRCTIHPYAFAKVVDGNVVKGHLIGCQYKSYTCINGLCLDNYGPNQINFSLRMEDHPGFCDLLCRNPMCTDPLGWQ